MLKHRLFAEQERDTKLSEFGNTFQLLDQRVNSTALAESVNHAAPRPSQERRGRPPFLTELKVRVLLIEQMFNLSDE